MFSDYEGERLFHAIQKINGENFQRTKELKDIDALKKLFEGSDGLNNIQNMINNIQLIHIDVSSAKYQLEELIELYKNKSEDSELILEEKIERFREQI